MELGEPIGVREEHEDIGGYEFEFVDELPLGQTCSICLLAMRNPVQTICGHRFCEECLLRTFRQGNGRVCPQDRNPVPLEGGFFRDVAWERDILSLRVRCKRNDRKCDWIGQLRHYEEHMINSCLYEDVVCARCNQDVWRKFSSAHATSECLNRIVQCEYCEEEFEFWRLEVHEGEECIRFPLDCPQQCGVTEIPREKLRCHITDDCLMSVVACPYKGAGCTFNDKRIYLEAHTEESIEFHLQKTWTQLVKTQDELKKVTETTEARVIEIQGRVEQLQTEKREMETSLQRNRDKISEENLSLKREVTELTQQLKDMNRSLTGRLQSEKEERETSFKRTSEDIDKLRLETLLFKRELEKKNATYAREDSSIQQLVKTVETMQARLEALESKDQRAAVIPPRPVLQKIPDSGLPLDFQQVITPIKESSKTPEDRIGCLPQSQRSTSAPTFTKPEVNHPVKCSETKPSREPLKTDRPAIVWPKTLAKNASTEPMKIREEKREEKGGELKRGEDLEKRGEEERKSVNAILGSSDSKISRKTMHSDLHGTTCHKRSYLNRK